MFQDLLPGSEVAHTNPVVAAAAAAVAAAVSSASEITVPIVSQTTVSSVFCMCLITQLCFFSFVTHTTKQCRRLQVFSLNQEMKFFPLQCLVVFITYAQRCCTVVMAQLDHDSDYIHMCSHWRMKMCDFYEKGDG